MLVRIDSHATISVSMVFNRLSRLLAIMCLLTLAGCRSGISPTVFVDPALATLVPADTVMLAGVRMEQLAKTQFWNNYVLKGRVGMLEDFRKRTGLDLAKDLWELLFAWDGRNPVVLVRGKFSEMGLEPKLQREGAQRFSYKSFTIIGDEATAVVFLNPSTAAAGSAPVLRRLIDNRDNVTGIPAALQQRIKKIPSTNQAWFAAQIAGTLPSMDRVPPGMWSNIARLVRSVQYATGALDLRNEFDATVDLETTSAQDADKVGGAIRALLGIGRLNTKESQREILSVYDGMHVSRENAVVHFSAGIPYPVLEKAAGELPIFGIK